MTTYEAMFYASGMRTWLEKWLERIGIVSVVWAIIRAIWKIIGHYGNFQTLWGLVKDWPAYLKYAALIVGSQWFPLVLAVLCLVAWWALKKIGRSYDAATLEHARIVPIGGNLEQKIKQWIDQHGFKHGNIPNGIQVLIPPRFIATIGRQKNRPSWLILESSILMSDKQRELFAKMSKEKKLSVFRAIRIECGRSEVEHHPHNDGSRRLVCIQKEIQIADLTESKLIDSIKKMHFATDVVMDTIDELIPTSVASSSAEQPTPMTGLQLRKECDRWIESAKNFHKRLSDAECHPQAVADAPKWFDDFQMFVEQNFTTVSDYDRLTYFRKLLNNPTSFDLENPAKRYQRALSYCFGNLTIIRNEIK